MGFDDHYDLNEQEKETTTMLTIRKVAIFTLMFALMAFAGLSPVQAKACDGFRGCRCGVTLARSLGLPLKYNGHNLKQAVEWKRAFPQTSVHVGAVMYRHGLGPTGHVSRVVGVNGGCSITVVDERGQHEDSACGRGAVFVDPNGNGLTANTAPQRVKVTKRRHYRSTRYATREMTQTFSFYNPADVR